MMKNSKERYYLLLSIFLAGMNYALAICMIRFGIPLYMDSVGTAIVAVLGGPVWGVVAAVFTQLFIILFNDFTLKYLYWMIGRIATAVIIGFFSQKKRNLNIIDFFLIVFSVTVANAVLGAIINMEAFGSDSSHPTDFITKGFHIIINNVWVAVLLARMTINLIDKSISVGIAFTVYRIMQYRIFRQNID